MIDINEVSKKSGFAPSKLRYYEEVGLIKSIGRKGLKRIFNESVLLNLSLISLGQEVGFSLKELKNMLGSNGQFKINRNKLIEKAHEIDLKMKKLKAVRDGLLHASACPEKSHLDCPKFQSYLKIAKK
ncbi:transcriptional regulator, MerR family [Bacteriovorax sp. BSW11_IV]|uniref:helix-turn-helix domain-containing protein n=1 Tax=Bacteriovorax sp. BSW11_IV TaxID=1353529 RepID=UPI00038A0337|nr:helix-turn-helix domain-containing protein [Bacteriovorax sp. BSW11_IV]EQC48612.1 transcriptional regulator, MerR family [Bacteriovorax sp. BSW11_IV]